MKFNIPNNFNLSPDYNYTYTVDLYVSSYSGTCDFLSLGSGSSDRTNAVSLAETHRWTGFQTGTWLKLAFTKSGSTLTFYINGGVSKTSTTSTYATLDASSWSNWGDCTSMLVIGGGYNSYNYTAYIKNVMFFNRALTQTEIQNMYAQQDIKIPFIDDCVFYAPLTNGYLAERISGIEPTSDTECSITWDTSNSMYKFSAVTTWNAAARYTGMKMGLTKGQACTLLIDVIEIAFSGNRYAVMIGMPKWRESMTLSYNIRHYAYNTGYSALTTLARYTVTHDGSGHIKWYKNGVLSATSTWAADRPLEEDHVDICMLPGNNYSYSMYAKNAVVYNRCLSATELATIQNLY